MTGNIGYTGGMNEYIVTDPRGNTLQGIKELTEAEVTALTEFGFTFRGRCPECTYFVSEGHSCVVYDGPPCTVPDCGAPTVVAQVAAPGYGTVRCCKAGHEEELTPCGIFTLEDVR